MRHRMEVGTSWYAVLCKKSFNTTYSSATQYRELIGEKKGPAYGQARLRNFSCRKGQLFVVVVVTRLIGADTLFESKLGHS